MEKIDLKKDLKTLYTAPADGFAVLDIPPLSYFMIDGHGDPNVEAGYREAVEALYAASYTLKFMSKADLGKDYVVPPLEGLWWAEDWNDFITRRKDRWSWTLMIMVPLFVVRSMAEAAIARAAGTKNRPALARVRFAMLEEGRVVQTLHIGSYDSEGPVLERMHRDFIPSQGLVETGLHHEIYLGDPRKSAPEKLRTILRQPVATV
jgi:hypothetical protein